MSGKPWFRLYADMPDNTKVGMLDDASHRAWVECLCFATRQGESGKIGTLDEINWMARRDYSEQLKVLLERELVTQIGDVYYVKNWRHRQRESDTSKARTRKYREAKKSGKSKKDVTSHTRHQKRHGDAPDTETDTEKEIEGSEDKSSSPSSAEVFRLPDWVPKPAWDSYLDMRKKIKAPPTENAKKLLVNELQRLRDRGHDPTQIIEKATRSNWKDFYEPKQENQGGSPNVRRYENQPTKFERGVAAAMRGLDTA